MNEFSKALEKKRLALQIPTHHLNSRYGQFNPPWPKQHGKHSIISPSYLEDKRDTSNVNLHSIQDGHTSPTRPKCKSNSTPLSASYRLGPTSTINVKKVTFNNNVAVIP